MSEDDILEAFDNLENGAGGVPAQLVMDCMQDMADILTRLEQRLIRVELRLEQIRPAPPPDDNPWRRREDPLQRKLGAPRVYEQSDDVNMKIIGETFERLTNNIRDLDLSAFTKSP